MHIPRIDNFEASVPTSPRDLKSGDRIATGWNSYDTVVSVEPTRTGARLTLRAGRHGNVYDIHRRSPVPVIKD